MFIVSVYCKCLLQVSIVSVYCKCLLRVSIVSIVSVYCNCLLRLSTVSLYCKCLFCLRSNLLKNHWFYCVIAQTCLKTNGFIACSLQQVAFLVRILVRKCKKRKTAKKKTLCLIWNIFIAFIFEDYFSKNSSENAPGSHGKPRQRSRKRGHRNQFY